MSRVRVQRLNLPVGLQGWVLVDPFGVPRFWPTIWQILRGPQLADSTLGGHLSAIERLYAHSSEIAGINLDRAIADVDISSLELVLGGFFMSLTNHAVSSGEDISQNWAAAIGFVRFMTRHLLPTGSTCLADIERTLLEQEILLSSLVPSRKKGRIQVWERTPPGEGMFKLATLASSS